MTTPAPKATMAICTSCGRGHAPHPEFGVYCDILCLAKTIRPFQPRPKEHTNAEHSHPPQPI